MTHSAVHQNLFPVFVFVFVFQGAGLAFLMTGECLEVVADEWSRALCYFQASAAAW